MQPPSPPPAQQPPSMYQAPVSWQPPVDSYGPAPGVRFAGPGARLVAYIVDGFILGLGIGVVSIVFAAVVAGAFVGAASTDTSGGTSGAAAGAAIGGSLLYVLIILLLSLAYFPWFWARGGQTPGMKMLHIRIVRDHDGGPISGGAAILRLVGFWVSSAVFYLGFIWIFIDRRRRGWHDLIAGTVVIEQP
jgi:uncharacterized RDD family membrane protein YckC